MSNYIFANSNKKKRRMRQWVTPICLAISFWFVLSSTGVLPILAELTDKHSYLEFLQNMEDFVPEEDAENKIEKDEWFHSHDHRLSRSEHITEPIEHEQCYEAKFYIEHIGDIISPPPDKLIESQNNQAV